MRNRPVGEILTALRSLGMEVSEGDRLPFAATGSGSVQGGAVVIDASASSQFVSPLLLARARDDPGLDVPTAGKPVPSLSHIKLQVALRAESRPVGREGYRAGRVR